MKKLIAVYLNHDSVPGWAMTDQQAANLERMLPQYRVQRCRTEAELIRILPEAEIVVTWFFRQEWVSVSGKMKVLATPAAGRDYFAVQLPEDVLRINGTFHGQFMAETALGMLLGMRRGLLQMAVNWKNELWPRVQLASVMRPLAGSTTMLFGVGNIGGCIGRLLKIFHSRVIGVRRNLSSPLPDWFSSGDRMISLREIDRFLPEADQVVMILPRSSETDMILTEERLSLLPSHAVICNLGRGNVIDEAALCRALRSGRLAGACLDVFQEEPLPENSPIRDCPNLWWQPHSSAISPTYLDAFNEDLVRQLRASGIL